MAADPNAIRDEFPLLANKTYLNSCSYGALSRSVERAFGAYLDSRRSNGSDWAVWAGQVERLRVALGRLLRCAPADVSIASSLSESVNALASAFSFSGGRDTVVVTDFDFPTTSQIWLSQQRRGARVVRARADDSGTAIPLQRFEKLIDDRTLLVSVPHVCYRNGAMLDLQPIIDLAHQRGALVLVDAYQSIGTLPLDAPASGADFIAGGCLKYLLGTAGLAFMYVRDSERNGTVPVATGWFAQQDMNAMDIHHNAPARGARRFEAGTPAVCAAYACTAGIELLLQTGLEAVQARIRDLTAAVIEGAVARGWRLVTPAAAERHGALMALASRDAPVLVERLSGDDVVVSDRDGNLRVSPHYYNDQRDIERLFASLDRHDELVRRA